MSEDTQRALTLLNWWGSWEGGLSEVGLPGEELGPRGRELP